MYKLMTLGALLVGLALAPVLSGGLDPEQEPLPELDEPHTSALPSAPVVAPDAENARSCEWACSACEAEQGCAQTCTEVGECGSSCGFIMQCNAGQNWNESSCACE